MAPTAGRTRRREATSLALVLVVRLSTLVTEARAAPPGVLARPIGAWSPGGYAPGGPTGGALVAVDGGGSVTLPAGDDPVVGSFAFGARGGWVFANGLEVHARYDHLGLQRRATGLESASLQLATGGLRYTLPFVLPMPFAEVNSGAGWLGGEARFAAGVGLGASLPLAAHVLIDVIGREWFVPVSGALRQTFTAGLGLAVTFASPSR